MEIRKTVKPEFLGFNFPNAGQTTIIDEAAMKRICLNCASLTYRKGQTGWPHDEVPRLTMRLTSLYQLDSGCARIRDNCHT